MIKYRVIALCILLMNSVHTYAFYDTPHTHDLSSLYVDWNNHGVYEDKVSTNQSNKKSTLTKQKNKHHIQIDPPVILTSPLEFDIHRFELNHY
jgi:hypothetical protein